jgi:anti-anti-sigma factor
MTCDHSPPGAVQPGPTPAPLLLDLHRQGPDAAVVHVRGELDRATAPTLASCLNELLDTGSRCKTLVIDLTAITFLDLGGLNLLLDAHQQAAARGTTFGLAGCGRQVLRILEITKTTELVRLVPGHTPAGGAAAPVGTGSTAHTDLPSSNAVTPQRVDTADTTCNPRPRGADGSIGGSRGGGHR